MVGSSFGPLGKETTFYDFVVKKEHLFLSNIYDEDDLKNSDGIKDTETHYKNFKRLIQCSHLLKKYYNGDSEINNVDHGCVETFIENYLNNQNENFGELHDVINKLQIKNSGFLKKRSDSNFRLKQIICFVCLKTTTFSKNKFIMDTIFSSKFLESVSDLMYNTHVIHHSHITDEIIGYAQGFCHRIVRENKSNISVLAHNLFGFNFFFLLKGIRLSVWKTTNLSIE